MNFEVLINNKIIFVEIVHKRRIKHCYLAIKSAQNLQIRAHKSYTINDAKKLIKNKENWLLKHINSTDSECHFVMEAIGVYHEKCADWLFNTGLKVSVVNPAHVDRGVLEAYFLLSSV